MKKRYHVKILLREIEKRKQKNSRYSLRAFAKFLGMAPSTLSRILAGNQELSVSATRKIMKKLEFSNEEMLLFIASVAEQKKQRTLQALEKLTGDANKDFKFTLESIASMAMKDFSDGCIILLKNDRQESVLHARHRENHFKEGNFTALSAPIFCHPVLSPDHPIFIEKKSEHHEILEHLNAHSLLCVPVKKGNEIFGAITFLRMEDRESFRDEDVGLALLLSEKAAYVHDLLSES